MQANEHHASDSQAGLSKALSPSATPSAMPSAMPHGPEQQLSIDTITVLLRQKLSSAIQNIIESGELLHEAKRLLGHGKFCNWLRENFRMSPKTANRFMSVASMVRQRKLQSEALSQIQSLDLKSLYELSARSTPEAVQEHVFEEIKAGKLVSYHHIRDLKKNFHSSQSAQLQKNPGMSHILPEFAVFVENMAKYSHLNPRHLPPLERQSRHELLAYADKLRQASALLEQILATLREGPEPARAGDPLAGHEA